MNYYPKQITRIRKLHAKVTTYKESDPEVSLILALNAANLVARLLFREHLDKDAGPLMLDKIIAQLPEGKELPKEILEDLQNIQKYVVSDFLGGDEDSEELTSEYILPCINSLDNVTKWITDKYFPEINIGPKIKVKDLAELLSLRPYLVIKDLISLKLYLNINQMMTFEIAKKVAAMHGFKCKQILKGTLRGKSKKA